MIYNKVRSTKTSLFAQKIATKSKRLDLCSAQIAQVFHLSGFSNNYPLRGKTCVEIGSGVVLSHALVFHLLGAKRVITTDIEKIAHPVKALKNSIQSSELSIIRDILAPFEDHDKIRSRLSNLYEIKNFSIDILEGLGIDYIAPIDFAKNPLRENVDFVFSISVLEHVPTTDILPLLNNLSEDLSNGGYMIHCIHLEDHKDIINAPFDFLTETNESFTPKIQSIRGNRVRYSEWKAILSQVKNMDFKTLYSWSRKDIELPQMIDPSITYKNNKDLIVSHLGIFGKKKKQN
jgi:hypothetical protein